MEVHVVTVFDSGDMRTFISGVFDSKEKAEAHKKELMDKAKINNDGYHKVANISTHTVQ